MKWLPKEKRNSFIFVVVITMAMLAAIGFCLLRAQRSTLASIAAGKNAASVQLENMEKAIKEADLLTNELVTATAALARAEGDMVTGDHYSWAYNTLRLFKQQYKVEIPEISQPAEGDVDLIPSFPYKQMRFIVSGKGYYHDIGKFVADFENNFPHIRVVNLVVEPAGIESDKEKLSFRMDIIALVKPSAS